MHLIDFWTFTGFDFSDPGPFFGSVISLIWNIIKMVFIGVGMGIYYVCAGIVLVVGSFFGWIISWDWEKIGDFFVKVITFPFKVIGKVLKVAIDVLKWILSTFADVLVWLIKLAMLIITLRFIFDPSSIGNLFKSKSEN